MILVFKLNKNIVFFKKFTFAFFMLVSIFGCDKNNWPGLVETESFYQY